MLESKLKEAKESRSIALGTSAFITGAQFTISGYDYVQLDPNNNESPIYPVFITTLSNISVNSLLKAKPVKPYEDKTTHEMVFAKRPEGTMHDKMRQIIAANTNDSNDELLKKLVEGLKDDTFVVRKREYIVKEGKYGDNAQPLVHIDIVKQ